MELRSPLAALALVGTLVVTPAPSAATTINFDNVANGTDISNAYAGVTFSDPVDGGGIFARASTTNASAPNVVSVFATGFPAFDARFGQVQAVFASPQRFVSIDAAILRASEGLGTPQNAPRLEAYDSGNTLLGFASWDFGQTPQPPAGGVTGFQTLSFAAASDSIASVRFFSGLPGQLPSNFGIFDNLVFRAGNGVPEPGTLGLLAASLLAGFALRRQRQ